MQETRANDREELNAWSSGPTSLNVFPYFPFGTKFSSNKITTKMDGTGRKTQKTGHNKPQVKNRDKISHYLFYCMILGAISVSVPMFIVAVEAFEFLLGIVPVDTPHG